jgi:hypothetical protein
MVAGGERGILPSDVVTMALLGDTVTRRVDCITPKQPDQAPLIRPTAVAQTSGYDAKVLRKNYFVVLAPGGASPHNTPLSAFAWRRLGPSSFKGF